MLIALALIAGVTGAWSPCGFSMVETLAPQGYARRLRTTAVACATFAAGALAGGVLTFGALALLGARLGANAPLVAAAIALAAAALEARGARILPQVRRQVPESWRRVMPVPLAAGLYGVLLGLGFTTFILSFAVWALAGIAVALGEPGTGVAIGLAFGAGRALPVIALAPSNGGRLHAAMAERPRILRGLRALDALALAIVAVVLTTTPARAAVKVTAVGYSDPSVDGLVQALHRPGKPNGELRTPGAAQPLPGNHPAVGGGRLAYLQDGNVVVQDVAALPAPGADALAVSTSWVVWRAAGALYVASLDPAQPANPHPFLFGNVGKPSLSGSLAVFELDGRIETFDLATGVRRVLRSESRAELRGPSLLGNRLTYVRATYKRQQVMTGPAFPRRVTSDRTLYGTTPTARRDSGHEAGRFPAKGHINKPLWQRPPRGVHDTLTTTATADSAVYVTRVRQLRNTPTTAAILRIDL
jgi:hypothetical protein